MRTANPNPPKNEWEFFPDELESVLDEIRAEPELLMEIPWARIFLATARLEELKDEDIRTFRGHRDSVAKDVVDYNIESMRQNLGLDRVDRLIGPLLSIDTIRKNIADLDILTIGPRTEAELFTLLGLGFAADRIRGLDLISYNPLVDLGDMHDMPYDADRFDVIVVGWTLTYSKDVRRVCDEIVRVARPGATVAIGINMESITLEDRKKRDGDAFLDATYYETTKEILDHFEGKIAAMIFHHDIDPAVQYAGELKVIFRLV